MNNDLGNLVPALSSSVYLSNFSKHEYLIHFKHSARYVKISKETYNLICLIDGNRNIKMIAEKFKILYGLAIEEDLIYTLLYKKLSSYGLLSCHTDLFVKAAKPSYLKLSFVIFNADIVSRFSTIFRFLFKARFSILIICTSIFILCYSVVLNFSLIKEFNLHTSLVYFFLLMFLSVTFHELGHATAARYYGAKHGGIGGGFYLLTPVYYADVTDIWRLSKKQRMIVNISGIYFELIFCSLTTLIGLVLGNFLLIVFSVIVFIKSLNNLNPLIRSDGYWILSDATNTPNLQGKALKRITLVFQWLIFRKKISWQLSDFLLFIYGSVSYIFIGMFLYYILIKNPNSILRFPENLFTFFSALFSSEPKFSMLKYAELIVPILFFYLLFNWLRATARYFLNNNVSKIDPSK